VDVHRLNPFRLRFGLRFRVATDSHPISSSNLDLSFSLPFVYTPAESSVK
jgi:hypothetical protein